MSKGAGTRVSSAAALSGESGLLRASSVSLRVVGLVVVVLLITGGGPPI